MKALSYFALISILVNPSNAFGRFAVSENNTLNKEPVQKIIPKPGRDIERSSPFVFIENKGQVTDQHGNVRHDIDYKLELGGITAFVGKGQIHYQWYKNRRTGNGDKHKGDEPTSIDAYRMDVSLHGANIHAEVVTEEVQNFHENYYGPEFPDGAVAHSCKKVTYKNIYPNIDWVLYTSAKAGALKYDFVVRQGGNVNDIQLTYGGATQLYLKNGALTAVTPFGNITEDAPYSYNIPLTPFEVGKGKVIPSSFVLEGNILRFNTYGVKDDIVIDPKIVPEFISYYGGNGEERFKVPYADYGSEVSEPSHYYKNDIATDLAGNSYFCGGTSSTNNIATVGAYQDTLTPLSYDGFFVKISANGQRQWATYYGGSGGDYFYAVATDVSGNVYIGGLTGSQGMASNNAYQTVFGGGASDGLFVKFNTAGQRIWASYYGGSATDEVFSIAVNNNNELFIGGSTNSTSGIATSGSFLSSGGGSQFSFLAKFTISGQRVWGTYYGGGAASIMCSLASDANGNIFGGGMGLGDVGARAGFATAFTASYHYGYIVKFNNAGQRIWGRFCNDNSGSAIVYRITLDKAGNVYAGGVNFGYSAGTGLYSTGAYFTNFTNALGYYGFLMKLNGTNGNPVWGTLLPSGFMVGGMAYDNTDKIYMGGISYIPKNNGLLISSDAYRTTTNSITWAGIFCMFDTAGGFRYGSYLGGNASSRITALAFDVNTRKLLIGGVTEGSSTAFTSPNAVQPIFGGGLFDNFICAAATDTAVYILQPFTDTLFCLGDSIHVPYEVTNTFKTNNAFSLELSDAGGSFASPQTIGFVYNTTAGVIDGKLPANMVVGSNYKIRIVATNPVRISLSDSLGIRIKSFAPNFFAASNNPVCTGDTIKLNGNSTAANGVTWLWTGPAFTSAAKDTFIVAADVTTMAGSYVLTAVYDGCTIRDTETITVKPLPIKPVATSNSPVCPGLGVNLNASSGSTGVSWLWTGPNGFSSPNGNTSRSNMGAADAGNYIVAANLNGCFSRDTETVVVYPVTPAPTAGSNSPVCIGAVLNLTASTVTGATYVWTGPGGYNSTVQNAARNNISLADGGIYSVRAIANGCYSVPAQVAVSTVLGPAVSIYPNPNDSICIGSNASLVAVPGSVNANLQYQWYKNSLAIGGATKINYPSSTIADGDTFMVTMLDPGSVCNTPIASNKIRMTVMPIVSGPAVSISVTPDTNVWPDQQLSFSANVTNCNGPVLYQWYANGKKIINATTNPWPANHLSEGTKINCVAKCLGWCPVPDTVMSNTLTMHVDTKVGEVGKGAFAVSLYPNPNGGVFTLRTSPLPPWKAEPVFLEVINALGQVVYSKYVRVAGALDEEIDMSAVANGVYMLRVKTDSGVGSVRFSVER